MAPAPDDKKSKNAYHNAFFLTLSLSVNCVQRYYDELLHYIRTKGVYYGIKVEKGESGKIHLHAIHITDWKRADNPDDPKADSRRCGKEHITYICNRCPAIKSAIVTFGCSKSFQSIPLTSSQWIIYLNKEGDMNVNNFPDEIDLLTQYFSEHNGPKKADPGLDLDSRLYEEFAEKTNKPNPPTHWKNCVSFYHYSYFTAKTKKQV